MELVVGTKRWSTWSLRPWLALKHTGATFTETLVGLRDSKRDLELKNSKLEERASARVRYTLRAVLSVFN